MPTVSIIVPVYKAEPYLARCVESLLGQTLSDIEIILVDDGSPDRCPQMCDEFAKADSRIRVIHKENGGVSAARNAGLDVAAGEYIAFADSDDWIDTNMYAAMMAQAREYDCDVVLCDCLKEFPDRAELYSHDIRGGYYSRDQLEHEYFPHFLMMENVEYPATISNWLLLFRRELADGLRYIADVRYSEDLLFGAQLIFKAHSFFYMKGEAYYHYRMNPNSATHRFVPDKWQDYRKLHAGIWEAFGTVEAFDFGRQIDLCLLFFVYNAVGDIYRAPLTGREKKQLILSILEDPQVREMFARLDIKALPISAKQKILTWLYRRRLGLSALIRYFGG